MLTNCDCNLIYCQNVKRCSSITVMFKKSLNNLKTSAPLRSSDRRKLKQRAVETFGLTSEEGNALVPDGILSVKFNTHLDEPGVRCSLSKKRSFSTQSLNAGSLY